MFTSNVVEQKFQWEQVEESMVRNFIDAYWFFKRRETDYFYENAFDIVC